MIEKGKHQPSPLVTNWGEELKDYNQNINNGVIVEVGPNIFPVYIYSREVLGRMKENAVYIGIDKNPTSLPVKRVGQHIVGHLFDLPLSSDSADEIWLMNVFGDMTNFIWYYSPFSNIHEGKPVPNHVFQKFFSELVRVLKPGGTINIGEYYDNPPTWLKEIDYTYFNLRKEIFEGERLSDFIEKYRMTGFVQKHINDAQLGNYSPYFLILQNDAKIRERLGRSGI